MHWQPLLQGEWKESALAGAQAIVDYVALPGSEPVADPSLESGAVAFGLLHAALAQSGMDRSRHIIGSIRCVRHALAAMRSSPRPASLFGGLTGAGWAVAHLQGRVPGLDGEGEDLAEIDGVLLNHLQQSRWWGTYDLIDGLVGFGVYALERLPRPAALTCIERIIENLAEMAEHRPDGITWASQPAWLAPEYRDERPLPYYDLGIAHGVPGVVAFLSLAFAAGVAVARARPLLEGAVCWILNQHPLESDFAVPCHVGPRITPVPGSLGYAYGDLGVAAALLQAARAVGEHSWEDAALIIALRAAALPPERSGIVQAGLFKGAAGVGHVFNRLFQATGEPRFGEAARFWFQRTLEMRSPTGEADGFFAWGPGPPGCRPIWMDNPRFLTGTAGIALALLGAATSVEPAWDRLLLVSIPPRGALNGERLPIGQKVAWRRMVDPPRTAVNDQRRWRRKGLPGSATLTLLGDVMLGRGVSTALSRRPPATFWGDVRPLLAAADVVIANLECVITERTEPWQKTAKGFHFRADPRAVDVLSAGRIQCVSLANNHSMDFGEQGLLDTIHYLGAAGIRHVGAGRSQSEAEVPTIIKAAGVKVAVIAVVDEEPASAAGPDLAGTNSVNIANDTFVMARVTHAAARARQLGAQLVVLSVHWGTDITLVPAAHFRSFARAAVESGVDLVYGHGDHVFQGVEVHGNGLILYGTGDFLDDYAVDPLLRYDWTFVFQVRIDARGIHSLDLVPVRIDFAQIRLATGADFEAIRARMCRQCADLGTAVTKTAEGLQVRVRPARVSAGVRQRCQPAGRER
jgi:poly-gamma-glutamate synthesis protein (capsule biosynthesis protein)